MSKENWRIALLIVNMAAVIAFLVITADIMMKHPCITWYIFGFISAVGVVGISFLVGFLIKQFGKSRGKHKE